METVYDELAESWHSFRRKPFPPIVETLADEWHGKILDVGCGNGRNLLAFEGELIGIDNSKRMVEIARKLAEEHKKNAVFLVADATKLPFKDAHFDAIICVATIHHLTLDKQLIALQEMKRVLKPEGRLLLTSWNKWQRRFIFGPKERMVPWTTKDKTFERYYYLHNMCSFKRLVKQAGFSIERSEGTFGRNVIIVAHKA